MKIQEANRIHKITAESKEGDIKTQDPEHENSKPAMD